MVGSRLMVDPQSEVTGLLLAWCQGDSAALARLMPLVEEELRRMAKRYMKLEDRNHTLQPTALVNELYLDLVNQRRVNWSKRAHFFAFAAEAMRRILVDHARRRRAQKRGEGMRAVSLEEISDVPERQDVDLIALDDALKSLAKVDKRQSRIVELRSFAGLSHEEVGEVLGISPRTARREWRTARLWLRQEMRRH